MTDYIMGRIESIFNSVSSAGTGNLILSPESFNQSIYNGIILIMRNAVMPVAYVLLSLFLLLELYNYTIRMESAHGISGLEYPAKIMLKIVLCKIVIDNTELILNAIFGMSSQLIVNINGIITGGNVLSPADLEAMRQTVESMNFGEQLMNGVIVTIIFIVVKFVMLIVSVIVVGRMIEIYIKMALSPLPMATFPNSEASNVGKNYLKDFIAVCLQGVIIYLVITIFPLLFGNATMGDINVSQDFTDGLFTAVGYSFVLLISVFASGKWAKSLCNAM